MSRIDDIETLSDNLASSTIRVMPKRCTYIRNWNSNCKHCLNVCKFDAIERSLGHLKINSDLCSNCGACVAACPTSTMLTTAPNQTDIVKAARTCAANFENIACFICERQAEELEIDETKVVVLPCLDYLDEYILIGLFACGISNVALMTTNCEECVTNPAPYFPTMVKSTKQVLKAWGTGRKVKIFHDIPEGLCHTGKRTRHSASGARRDALTGAGGSLMSYAMSQVDQLLGDAPKKENPDKQIIVRTDDVYPADTYRSVRVLGMLDRIGTRPKGTAVESRFWAMVNIDPDKCKRCGACATLCVTDALHYEQEEAATKRMQRMMPGTLTFEPALCMHCNLCQDTCVRKALKVSSRVMAEDLDEGYKVTFFENEKPVNNNKFGF